MALHESTNVAARVRPFSDWIESNQQTCVKVNSMNSSISITTTDPVKTFAFNHVFDENTTQDTVFDKVAKSIVDNFFEGFNGTIFAYGQTGSGKTFTMLGPDSSSNEENLEKRGVIPRAVQYIFELLRNESEKKSDKFKYYMKCSFLELYNENLYDLLQPSNSAVKVRYNVDQLCLVGAAQFETSSYEECMGYLWDGWKKRQVAETAMNRESSRSHAIFMITLVTEHVNGAIINRRTSRLNLVDLAGSERQGQTKNTGDRLREAGNINKSLSTLARVIRSLATAPSTEEYISYRDSLLTYLLRDSLGGNARTAVIINIHPNHRFVGETTSTLQFAENVKKVKNKAVVNEDVSCEDIAAWKAEIERLRQENRELKALPPTILIENPKSEKEDHNGFAHLAAERDKLLKAVEEAECRAKQLQEINEEMAVILRRERSEKEELAAERDKLLEAIEEPQLQVKELQETNKEMAGILQRERVEKEDLEKRYNELLTELTAERDAHVKSKAEYRDVRLETSRDASPAKFLSELQKKLSYCRRIIDNARYAEGGILLTSSKTSRPGTPVRYDRSLLGGPMNLITITCKLSHLKYSTPEEIWHDCLLMFRNFRFDNNEEPELIERANRLEESMKKEFQQIIGNDFN